MKSKNKSKSTQVLEPSEATWRVYSTRTRSFMASCQQTTTFTMACLATSNKYRKHRITWGHSQFRQFAKAAGVATAEWMWSEALSMLWNQFFQTISKIISVSVQTAKTSSRYLLITCLILWIAESILPKSVMAMMLSLSSRTSLTLWMTTRRTTSWASSRFSALLSLATKSNHKIIKGRKMIKRQYITITR